MSNILVVILIAYLAYAEESPRLIRGLRCNCPNKSLPPCPDFRACAAITCGPGFSCEPCPCDCNNARCVPTAPLPTPGLVCNCSNKSLPPCPDFGACAAITCGPGFSCEPCPCNCNIARCVPTAPLPTPGPECQCRNETLPPCPDFGACAAITCGPGFSCEPCPCNCNIARCVPTAPLPTSGQGCQCSNETLPPCPDFGACAAITCGPGFSCEPCPCNCEIARCVPTAPLQTPGRRCKWRNKFLPPCRDRRACAAKTCRPGFSCVPYRCNCKIARCVRRRPYATW